MGMNPDQQAFIDVTCSKCGKFFGWFGTMMQRPPCPKCGHDLSEADKAKNEAAFDDLRKAIRERQRKLDELCKGEFKEAYEAGVAVSKTHPPSPLWEGGPPLAAKGAFDLCPYERTSKRGAESDGLDEHAAWTKGYWASTREQD